LDDPCSQARSKLAEQADGELVGKPGSVTRVGIIVGMRAALPRDPERLVAGLLEHPAGIRRQEPPAHEAPPASWSFTLVGMNNARHAMRTASALTIMLMATSR